MVIKASFSKASIFYSRPDICFVFAHGWGFDAEFWQPLQKTLRAAHVVSLDRGYFSQEPISFSKDWFSSNKIIGVGHSIGLLHLMQTGWPFQALVGIQSLPVFAGLDLCRRQEAAIFLNHFRLNPLTTLKRFYARCDMPFLQDEKKIQVDRLEKDLLLLFSQELTPSCPTLLIAADHDIVAPISYFQRACETSSYYKLQVLPYDKHNLGHRRPEDIKDMIGGFLEQHRDAF